MNTRILSMIFSVAVISACGGSEEVDLSDGSGCDGSAENACNGSGEVDAPEEEPEEEPEEDIEEPEEIVEEPEEIVEGKTALEQFIDKCRSPVFPGTMNIGLDGNSGCNLSESDCVSIDCNCLEDYLGPNRTDYPTPEQVVDSLCPDTSDGSGEGSGDGSGQ